MASSSPYVGYCIRCGRLKELDTSTALCLSTKGCKRAEANLDDPQTKKEDSNGS